MSAVATTSRERVEQAVNEFSVRWLKATDCFCAADQPQWKRTTEALLCFKGLPLDHLPPKFRRRIESCFLKVNHILAGYALQTFEDYQNVTSEDLSQIEKLIIEIV
jgi:hypothetical protein